MDVVTATARWLRIDRLSWTRLATTGTVGSAVMVTMGAYAIFVFDRFGVQSFLLPRASVRLLLLGLYGWLWLAGSSWFVARRMLGSQAPFDRTLSLFGYAHLPLLLLALGIQVLSVGLQAPALARGLALFAILFWFPALLVGAARSSFEVDSNAAVRVVAGPYVGWLAVIGTQLWFQVGHLL